MKILRKAAVATAAMGVMVGPSLTALAAEPATATVQGESFVTAAKVTERIAGDDRYATAAAVSQHLYPSGADVVFVANGTDFPDALAGGPGAVHQDAPVLLVSSATNVPKVTQAELRRLAPEEIVILGGSSVVGDAAVKTLEGIAPVSRLAGDDRYATAAAVAGLWSQASTVYVAAGRSYPDALAGGAAAAHQDAPVLLAGSKALSQATRERLVELSPSRVVVLGGSSAVPGTVVEDIKKAVPGAGVVRYEGEDRYDTAQVVASKVWQDGSPEAFYATGTAFPDALAGVPAAASHQAPLLLVRTECAPSATQAATTDLGVVTEYLLGGTSAIHQGATTTDCGPTPPAVDTVLSVLEGIPVKGRAPKTGYDRDKFGPEWTDDNDVQGGKNGCDTRNDVLRRDLTDKKIKPNTNGCVVQTGMLKDPFTGTNMPFERGVTSSEIHIDHLVALSDAWQKGAQQLTERQRRNFANDPLNLWAVNGSQNMSKGDSDAATWLPPNKAIRCSYVAYQTAVKDKYGLWMTKAEKDAITRIVTTSCPDQKIPKSNNVPPLGQ